MTADRTTLRGDGRLLLLAVGVGALTGAVMVGFHATIEALQSARLAAEAAGGPWGALVRLLGPALAGLAVGLIFYRWMRHTGGYGVPLVIRAAVDDRPLADWRMAVKSASAAGVIGAGGSVGPEGPVIEIGAVAGSYVWKFFRLPPDQVRTLMGCGAAAGIAAVFNAPIGGVLFVLEVVLRDFRARVVVPLILAAMTSSLIMAGAVGSQPTIDLPAPQVNGPLWLLVLPTALLCSLLSAAFIVASERLGGAIHRVAAPAWVKPTLAGLAVGLVGVFLPGVLGSGYAYTHQIVALPPAADLLAAWLLAKLLCTVITLASGTPGGAFAPALVMGGGAGLLVAQAFDHLDVNATAAALVGMAGALAGTFHAPITAILITLKLGHHDPDTLMAIMGSAALSTWLTRRLVTGNLYDVVLLRQGLRLDTSRTIKVLLADRQVHEAMQVQPATLRPEQTLGQMLDVMANRAQETYPVLDAAGRAVGVVEMALVREALRSQTHPELIIAQDLMGPAPPAVTPASTMEEAWRRLHGQPFDELLVVEPAADEVSPPKVVGLIRRGDLLT